MGEFASWYQNGGGFMHYILLLALSGAALGLLAALTRRRALVSGALLNAAACLVIGIVGWQIGLVDMRNAAATVAPDQLAMVVERGSEIAIVPLHFAALACVPAVLGGLLALVLGAKSRE